MKALVLFLKGIVIGMANVIPGVSGGTLAVVFNIYDKFINVITPNVKKLWANKNFLVPLLCGMATGVLLFSKMVSFLYENFPVQTNFVFSGLILGSVPLIFGYTKKRKDEKKFNVGFAISIFACVAAGFFLILLFASLDGKVDRTQITENILPPVSAKLALKIFVAGILGAVVMIVPGISGSLIMLIMGVYTIVITSIPALLNPQTFMHALLLLLPNGIGVIIGLLCGAKMISFFLKKIPNHTYAVILGLLCGSFFTIFPGVSGVANFLMAISCVICFAFGILLAYFGSKSGD